MVYWIKSIENQETINISFDVIGENRLEQQVYIVL